MGSALLLENPLPHIYGQIKSVLHFAMLCRILYTVSFIIVYMAKKNLICGEEENYDEERTIPMSTAVGFSASEKKVSLEDSGEECR